MGEVTPLNVVPREETSPAQRVINEAAAAGLETVVIVGQHDDGTLYYESSAEDDKETFWLLGRAIRYLANWHAD